jgi:hypothetical protein
MPAAAPCLSPISLHLSLYAHCHALSLLLRQPCRSMHLGCWVRFGSFYTVPTYTYDTVPQIALCFRVAPVHQGMSDSLRKQWRRVCRFQVCCLSTPRPCSNGCPRVVVRMQSSLARPVEAGFLMLLSDALPFLPPPRSLALSYYLLRQR